MRIILVKDKWDDYTIDATDLPTAAFTLLSERVEEGYWYVNWNDDDPKHQYEDRATDIVKRGAAEEAWPFLLERREVEYEWVELQETR